MALLIATKNTWLLKCLNNSMTLIMMIPSVQWLMLGINLNEEKKKKRKEGSFYFWVLKLSKKNQYLF